jgi:3'-5' exoribonuclease Rv2179c-like domain
MKYYIDSEFIDNGKTIDLISIGIVNSDGREYYAQSCEFNPKMASEWVKENVFQHLNTCVWASIATHPTHSPFPVGEVSFHCHGQCVDQQRGLIHNCPWRTRKRIAKEIVAFIADDPKPEFWSWCGAYDFVALCQLFGTMMDIPASWPHYIRDLQYLLDQESIDDDDLPQQENGLHNALEDARHIKKLWECVS